MEQETGFDCEFVDDPPKELHTECSVCLSVLRQPYLVDCCGNHFCKACLEKVSQEKKECPLCKDKDFRAILDKGLERVLNQTNVYCSNKEIGCDWTGELRELDSHLNAASPSVDGSNKEPRISWCQFVEVRCQYCPVTVRRSQMTEHLTVCPNKPILCKYCKKHKASPEDMTKFHDPVCPKYPVKCPKKCGAKLQRKNLAKHVDTTCPLIKIPCTYAHVGCTVVTNRKQLDNHMKTAIASHLSLVDKAYSELLESTDGSSAEVEHLRGQIQGLKLSHSHDMESLQRENRSLMDQVDRQQAQIHRLCQHINHLQAQLDSASVKSVSKSSFPARSTSEVKLYKPSTYHGAAAVDYPDSKGPYSYKPSTGSGWKAYDSSVAVAQPPKKKESSSGWLTALGAGLGVALGVGVAAAGAAALASRSSSSKKDDEDDWDDYDD